MRLCSGGSARPRRCFSTTRFQRADATVSRWASGEWPHHVSPRVRRRNPDQPRPADGAARTRTRVSRERAFPAAVGCEQSYIGLTSVDKPASHFVAYINLIRGSTTGDIKRPYISPALRRKEKAMTPQERQLVDD